MLAGKRLAYTFVIYRGTCCGGLSALGSRALILRMHHAHSLYLFAHLILTLDALRACTGGLTSALDE